MSGAASATSHTFRLEPVSEHMPYETPVPGLNVFESLPDEIAQYILTDPSLGADRPSIRGVSHTWDNLLADATKTTTRCIHRPVYLFVPGVLVSGADGTCADAAAIVNRRIRHAVSLTPPDLRRDTTGGFDDVRLTSLVRYFGIEVATSDFRNAVARRLTIKRAQINKARLAAVLRSIGRTLVSVDADNEDTMIDMWNAIRLSLHGDFPAGAAAPVSCAFVNNDDDGGDSVSRALGFKMDFGSDHVEKPAPLYARNAINAGHAAYISDNEIGPNISTALYSQYTLPNSDQLVYWGDPHLVPLLLGGDLVRAGDVTLFNGYHSRADSCGLWIRVANMTLRIRSLMKLAEPASALEQALNHAAANILMREYRLVTRDTFDFEHSRRARLRGTATTTDGAGPLAEPDWDAQLALYDYQKDTVRGMMQLEADIRDNKPIQLNAFGVCPVPDTAARLYVDLVTMRLLSAAEGFALRSARDPRRSDNALLSLRGGLLMDEVGMGKTRQVIALIRHHPMPDRPFDQSEIDIDVDRESQARTAIANAYCGKEVDVVDMPPFFMAHSQGVIWKRASSISAGTRRSHIATGATLVVCHNHLIHQWQQEAGAVFPDRGDVVVIATIVHLRKLTYGDLHRARVVIVTCEFLRGDQYRTFANALDASDEYHLIQRDSEYMALRYRANVSCPHLGYFQWARLVVDELSVLNDAPAPSRSNKNKKKGAIHEPSQWSTQAPQFFISIHSVLGRLCAVTRWLLTATIDDAFTRKKASYMAECDNSVLHLSILSRFLGWRFALLPSSGSPEEHRGAPVFPFRSPFTYGLVLAAEGLKASTLRKTRAMISREQRLCRPVHSIVTYPVMTHEATLAEILCSSVPFLGTASSLAALHIMGNHRSRYGDVVLADPMYADEAVSNVFVDAVTAPDTLPLDPVVQQPLQMAIKKYLLDGTVLWEPSTAPDTIAASFISKFESTRYPLSAGEIFVPDIAPAYLELRPCASFMSSLDAWIRYYRTLAHQLPDFIAEQRAAFHGARVMVVHYVLDRRDAPVPERACVITMRINKNATKMIKCLRQITLARYVLSLVHDTWIAPLERLRERAVLERGQLLADAAALASEKLQLDSFERGSRMVAVTRTLAHLWTHSPTMGVIIASVHLQALRQMADWLTERGVDYVDYNHGNYAVKRKALRSLDNEVRAPRAILMLMSKSQGVHEGSNLPMASTVLFLDNLEQPSQYRALSAAEVQTIGRVYRTNQRFKVNVIHVAKNGGEDLAALTKVIAGAAHVSVETLSA